MFIQKTLGSIYVLLFICTSLIAQDWDNYQSLKASGAIPKEFLVSSTEKYSSQKEIISKESKKRERRTEEQFYLQSIFAIDQLLLSGEVLFNDPITDYVNSVAANVLKSEPDLVKKIRFYVVKSPIANAFATNRGVILINLGLLAQLENEAQLAYIISHEVTHYKEKHIIKAYVKNRSLDTRQGMGRKLNRYKKSADYELMLIKSNYSKQNEKEADSYGLERYLKSSYSTEATVRVFDILKNSNAPYTSFEFMPSLLETTYFSNLDSVIEKATYVATVKKGTFKLVDDEYEEDGIKQRKLDTHPSPDERKEAIIEKLQGKPSGGAYFILEESEFKKVTKLAQFELSKMFLNKKAYFDALYHSVILLKKHPNSAYLKLNIAKALYGMTKYRNANKDYNTFLEYDNLPEETKGITGVPFLSRIDLNNLALTYAYDLYKKDKSNEYLHKICLDLINEGFISHQSAYKKESENVVLARALADEGFMDLFDEQMQAYEKEQDRKAFFKTKKGKKELANWNREVRVHGWNLGAEKLVVFLPQSYYFELRKGRAKKNNSVIDPIISESHHQELCKQFKAVGNEIGLDVEVLDMKTLSSNGDIARYNDAAIINAWYKEVLNHNSIENDFIPSNYDEVMMLTEKYGTSFFANVGVLSFKAKRNPFFVYMGAAGSLMLPIFTPLAIAKIFTPRKRALFYSLVYNVKQNRPVMATEKEKKVAVKASVLNKQAKQTLSQIKSKQK